MKYKCDGYLRIPETLAKQYVQETGRSKRTFYNHRKWLIEHGWIVKMKKGGFRVLGYRQLLELIDVALPRQRGAIMNCDLINFRAFVSAVAVTHVGRVKRYVDKRTGNKNKGIASRHLYNSFNCPHAYLATVLDISKSSAQNIRTDAMKFLQVKQDFLPYDSGQPNHLLTHRKYSDENICDLRIREGKLCEQLPSKIRSEIIIKRCRH
uniref:hypothetical protein n=1 Tax=uncultured Draconibacterium sp. TaxID=1573823 RepID=UPI0032165521